MNETNKTQNDRPSYGAPPFGRASPYLSAAAFAFVVCFIANLDRVASALKLEASDIQAGILFSSLVGAVIGFTATWDQNQKAKGIGAIFCALNCVVFISYASLFWIFAHSRK